ncbi:MAG: methylenetetrahydrofolate reductase [NAD(P)H] [Bryobacterales bacterium]
MKIIDILRGGKRTVSFEFFPPKTDAGFDELFRAIAALEPLAPDFVSVTYGAGGSTRSKTVDLVKRIKREIGIEAMAHLTCVGSTQDDIAAVLDDLDQAGLENVLPLRGDPPKGETEFRAVEGGFRYANELVAFIRPRYRFCLAGACYPERHPEAISSEVDLENLKRKVDAGVDFLITNLFFDNEDFYRFRDRAAKIGIELPLLAGIMPIRNVKQIKRVTEMCGASLPAALLRKIEAVEDDGEAVAQVGVTHAVRQCEDLLANGVSGLHFYTLNRSTATRAIFQEIRDLL